MPGRSAMATVEEMESQLMRISGGGRWEVVLERERERERERDWEIDRGWR